MCTLVVIKNLLPEAPLVLAANRDEAYARAWDGPSYDPSSPGIWRPTDRSAGGTWIGINGAHLTVAVTNRRPIKPIPHRRSRGLLCADILAAPSVFAARLALEDALDHTPYNEFNMLVASAREAFVLHHEANQTRAIPLPDGVHILSNFHDLDDPVWHTTRANLAAFAQRGWPALHAALCRILASHTPAQDGHLTCKHGQHYGTLCSSIIRIAQDDAPTFWFASGAPCVSPFIRTPLT